MMGAGRAVALYPRPRRKAKPTPAAMPAWPCDSPRLGPRTEERETFTRLPGLPLKESAW